MGTKQPDESVPRRILIFSTGSLGDTLLVIPAIRALRQHYPKAKFVLLSDVQANSSYVLATNVLSGTGLIDEFLTYTVHHGRLARIRTIAETLGLAVRLRLEGFDTLAYCVEAWHGDQRVKRDKFFFRVAGVRRFIGMESLEVRRSATGFDIETVTHRVDELLHRFGAAGIPMPSAEKRVLDLNLKASDRMAFHQWRRELSSDGGRLWIGIGPGSKMPAKVWPFEHFEELGKRLIDSFNVWPVVFGGPEDVMLGERLTQSWRCGYVAAGVLGIRDTAVAFERCLLYVGNDTGTMHLAAAVGTPCVAIFSAREPAGRWHPYGSGHRVFRSAIECAGCNLKICTERSNACLKAIEVNAVFDACASVLASTPSLSIC